MIRQRRYVGRVGERSKHYPVQNYVAYEGFLIRDRRSRTLALILHPVRVGLHGLRAVKSQSIDGLRGLLGAGQRTRRHRHPDQGRGGLRQHVRVPAYARRDGLGAPLSHGTSPTRGVGLVGRPEAGLPSEAASTPVFLCVAVVRVL